MDIRVRAAGKTAGWLAIVTSIPALMIWLNVSSETIGWMFFVGFFGYMIWTIYNIFLYQLKYDDKLKETVAKLENKS
jgi:hypothetical protein